MPQLPTVRTVGELAGLIGEVGFLPLFPGGLPGLSVYEATEPAAWWNEGAPEGDPWEWRKQLAASGQAAYGKFFGGKSAYVSLDWFPVLANYRRDGYDFDALADEGRVPYRERLVMALFSGDEGYSSFEIKRRAGFGKDGHKGFQGVLTALMARTYLVVSGFARKVNKKGEPYGWDVGLHRNPESFFGYDFTRSGYKEDPAESRERLIRRCEKLAPEASPADILKFIG